MFLGGDWHPATRLVNFCSATRGRVAQLGERLVRNEEAEGSNPFSSTNSVPYNTLRARRASRSSPGRPRVRIPSRPPIPSPTTHSALAERPGPHREGRGFESLLVHQFRPLQHTPRSQSVPVLTGKAEGSNPFSSTKFTGCHSAFPANPHFTDSIKSLHPLRMASVIRKATGPP